MEITPEQLREELTRGGRFTQEDVNELVARHEQIERERARSPHLDLGIGRRQEPPHSGPLAPSNIPPHDRSMADADRLSKLEGAYDALKVVRPMTVTVIGIFLAALVFVLGFLTTQLMATNAKIDALPQRLSEEFRAMRAEMAAQTSAIANSITATRQTQPPAPPQIIVIPPAPQPQPAPEPPKP
jgi:hypothetical protein